MATNTSKSPIDCCTKECFLCNELNDRDALSTYLGLYEKPEDKILAQSEHFVAMFDICPIVPGHTLLMTRDHKLSMAQIPKDWYEELKTIKQAVVSRLHQQYCQPFCFEHGSALGDVASGTCIDHAHLHLIPTEVSIMDAMRTSVSKDITLQPIDFIQALNKITGSYLYYENSEHLGFVIHPKQPLPHQFIRIVVARSLGLTKWDWKEIGFPYLS